jgi:alkylhydroperoxidase family enzyme
MDGPETAGWSSFERALLRAADELHKSATITDRTWAYLDARYDEKQLMDVVFTVGQYNLVSWALRSFRVPMDEGLEGFPKR